MNAKKVLTNRQLGAFVLLTKYKRLVVLVLLVFLLVPLSFCASSSNPAAGQEKKKPVIFDTDICDDIDDTWALALLLQSPEFDIKLITTAVRNTPSKAKVVAKFLLLKSSVNII